MKRNTRSLVTFSILGALGLVAFEALADQSSASFTIEYIEAGIAPEDGMALRPLNYTVPNPKNCPATGGWVMANPNRTAAEKAAMDKLLTGAFLAGKQVSVIIDSSRCSTGTSSGFPVYNYATVKYDQ